MNKIAIPDTGIELCPIILGTVNAGLAYDGKEADLLFNRYLELGGNVLDSARVYYDWVPPEIGRSERVIGDWLRRESKRNQVVLITKGGHPDKDLMNVGRMGQADMEYDINLSLKTLGTDNIDIYFYHRDDVTLPVGELLERMEGFRKSGKIRYYGCSNWTTARMLEADEYARAHGLRGFVANQMLYNYASKYMKPFDDETMVTMDDEMFAYHTNNPKNVAMPYFGVCSGFFHLLASGDLDKVKDSPYYTPKNVELMNRISTLCEKYNASITQILTGFFMAQEFIVLPLVGSIDSEQLEDAMGTLNYTFDKNEFAL